MPKVSVLGVGVDPLRLDELLNRIHSAGPEARLLVAHANITGLNLAYTRPGMRDFYNHCANVVYADGMGVLVGARLLGRQIPERYTLADWVWPLADGLEARGQSLYLLGAAPGVAGRAAGVLQMRYPDLRIAGNMHGFFDKSPGSPENEALLQAINASGAHLLLVGFGMPTQEAWLKDNWTRLTVPCAITVGALFEYLSGDLPRGPAWMTNHYLEWLARLLISPRRYALRYFRDIPLFGWRILKEKVSHGR